MAELTWHDIRTLGIRGRGWSDTHSPYDRLPVRAEEIATEAVWNLSRHSAGLYVDFTSDTTELHARTTLRQQPGEAISYINYLDLYCRVGEAGWRWAAISRNGYLPSGETPLIQQLPAGERQWRLYLPLNYLVESVHLGISAGAAIAAAPADPRPPIVIYGTSIVHGLHHLSRPGMAWPSILARRLDYPLINLGFSGSARSEPPLGQLIAELDPALFIVDPLANMSQEHVEENLEPFLRHLLARRPATPILLMEDRTHANAWLFPDYAPRQEAKQAACRAIFERLRAEGHPLHYLPGGDLIGDDYEGTTDASHPSDLGAMRYADAVTPAVARLLKLPS